MIAGAAGYEILDVTGLEGFITGEIMPVRMRKGTERVIRYEDLLFLAEARLERQRWRTLDRDAVVKVAPPGRILDARTFCERTWLGRDDFVQRRAVQGIKDYDPYAVLPLQKLENELGQLEAGEYEIALMGSRLSRAAVEARYADLADAKIGVMEAGGRAMTVVTGQNSWGDIHVPISTTYMYEYICHYVHGPDADTGEMVTYDHGADSQTASGSGILLPYAKSANMAVCGECSCDGEGRQTEVHHFVMMAGDCDVVAEGRNRRITISDVEYRSMAENVANHYGMPWGSGHEFNGSVLIAFTEAYLIVENEFPAEIDSLEWDWKPEEAEG